MARPTYRLEAFDGVDRSPLGRARALADGLVNTIRLSAALIGTHRHVELSGLEAAVGLLCAKALDLDPTQGRLLLPELTAILAEIRGLTDTLEEHEPLAP